MVMIYCAQLVSCVVRYETCFPLTSGSSKGKTPGGKLRNPRKRRPQKQRERDSAEVDLDEAPLKRPPGGGGRVRQRGKATNNYNNGVGQDREGVTGFINAFRRLIQRVI